MINVSQAFHRTSANAIDETLTLTKAQMVATNDNLMPDKYLTVCQDDGKIYLYDKSNSIDVSTGRFRVFEGAGSITIDDAPTQGSTNAVQSGGTYTALDEKVDKVSGKGLSTNDYTNEEKSKLAGIDLTNYIPTSQKGVSNGVATIGSNGKIPMSQIPNGLDETIIGYRNEADGLFYEDSSFTEPITPQAGLFYYDELSTNFYRWNGSAFVSFTDGSTGIVIGEVTGTAYDGGKGKENRDAIGTLANLSTTSKTDLVSAVNEVNTNKVDKVAGKVLSDNNFTDAYKNAIDDLDVDISNKQNKTLSAPRTIEGASITTVENGVDATKTHTDRSVTDTNGVHGFKVEESATKNEILFKSGDTWITIPTSPAIQFPSLPTASGTLVGKVYQYTGATDSTYTHNFYYECVSNGSGGYTWAETPVMYVDKSRVTEMPTASADELGNVYQYIGESSPTGYQKGYFYECVRNGQSYTWLGLRVQSGGGQTIQYDQMPEASVDNLNQIIQYIGETTSVAPIYTNGYFYKCVAQGTDPETYAWEEIRVSEAKEERIGEEITEIGVDYDATRTDSRIIPYINVNVLDVLTDGGRTLTVSDLEYVASLYHEGRVTQSEFEDVFGETSIPFGTASLDDILKVVEMYYDGDLSLSDIQTKWSIGDSRAITISAISAYDSVSQPQNNTEVVIVDFNHFTLTDSYKSNTQPLLVLGLKNPMPNGMRRVGDQKYGYPNWGIRTWVTSESYFAGSLPSDYKNNIKAVSRQVVVNGKSADQLETINDAIFIPTEKEWATTGYLSNLVDGSTLSYYEDITHRQKEVQLMTATKDGFYSSIILTNGNVARSSGVGDSNEYLGIIPHFCI